MGAPVSKSTSFPPHPSENPALSPSFPSLPIPSDDSPLIQAPQSFPVPLYDKSASLDNSSLSPLKPVQQIEFQAEKGVFWRKNRLKTGLKPLKNTCFFVSDRKKKGLELLSEIYPGIGVLGTRDTSFGTVFVVREGEGLKGVLFGSEKEGMGWIEGVIVVLMGIFGLGHLRNDRRVLESLKNRVKVGVIGQKGEENLKFTERMGRNEDLLQKSTIRTAENKSQTPKMTARMGNSLLNGPYNDPLIPPNIHPPPSLSLVEIQVTDYPLSSLLSRYQSENRPIPRSLVLKTLKDLTASILYQSGDQDSSLASQITPNNTHYIEALDTFTFWQPDPDQIPAFEEDLISKIPHPIQTIVDSIDKSMIEGLGMGGVYSESLQNSLFSEQQGLLQQTGTVVEGLGMLVKGLVEAEGGDACDPSLSFLQHINHELYVPYPYDYYLETEGLQAYRARSLLNLMLRPSDRISLIGLVFYLQLEVLLHPWKRLFKSPGLIFKPSGSKTGVFTNIVPSPNTTLNGLEYEGEYRSIGEIKLAHGKGVLRDLASATTLYEGFWKHGRFHGEGVFLIPSLAGAYLYKGSFRSGSCEGQGTLYFASKRLYSGLFNRITGYFNDFHSPKVVSPSPLEESAGCLISFSGPLQTKGGEMLAARLQEHHEFELKEFSLLGVRAKEPLFSRICGWIARQMKGIKAFVIVHCLPDEDIWVIDGFDVATLQLKLRVYVSKRPMRVKAMVMALRGLKDLFEDFAVKLKLQIEVQEEHQLQGFLEELSLHSFSIYKLKKLDLVGMAEIGTGGRGREACEKLFASFLIHKLKRLDIKAGTITDGFFEIMKKSPYLGLLEDLVLKNCWRLTEKAFTSLSESRTMTSLRTLTITRSKLTNEGLLSLCRSQFSDSLEKLNLSENYLLDDSGLTEFFRKARMKALRKLYLSYNRLTDSGVRVLFENSHFSALSKLKLAKCPVFDSYSPDEPSSLRLLAKIDLSRTLLDHPRALRLLKGYPGLTGLKLGDCQGLHGVDQELSQALAELKSLKKLDLRGLNLPPVNLEPIAKRCPKLTGLNLKRNPLISAIGVLPLLLSPSPKLFVLDLSYTGVSDDCFLGFSASSQVSELRNLLLAHTMVSDASLNAIFTMGLFPQLRVLDLSYTGVTNIGVGTIAANLLANRLYDLSLEGCKGVDQDGVRLLLHYYPSSYLKRLNIRGIALKEGFMAHRGFFLMKGLMKLSLEGTGLTRSGLRKAFKDRIKGRKPRVSVKNDGFEGVLAGNSEEMLDLKGFYGVSEAEIARNIEKRLYFTVLKVLSLEGLDIGDVLVSKLCEWGSLGSLLTLNLSKTAVTDNGLFRMSVSSVFSGLDRLDLRDCDSITDTGAGDILGSLVLRVGELDLTGTKVGDKTVEAARKASENGGLREIWLFLCPFVSPEAVEKVNRGYNVLVYY